MKDKKIKIRDIVELILEEQPQTRRSDNELYKQVVIYLFPQAKEKSFVYVLDHYQINYATVIRERRIIQQLRPELVDSEIAYYRAEKQFKFWEEYR